MKDKLEKAVKSCADKAESAEKSDDALKFTQAALNATHALRTLKDC